MKKKVLVCGATGFIGRNIAEYFSKNNKLTVSEFKNIAKTSRKYAVPLLEYFDKQKITYREDNYRKLA